MKTKKAGHKFRWIDDDEPEQVARISQEVFDPPDFMTLDDVLWFMDQTDYVPRVLVVDGEVVAYNFYILHNRVVEIYQTAVAPEHQGKGYEKLVIAPLVMSMPALRRRALLAKIPETDLPTQVLLRDDFGFRWFKTIRRDMAEDLFAMRKILPRAA